MDVKKAKKLQSKLEGILQKYFSIQNNFLKENRDVETIVEMRLISYVGNSGRCRMKEISEYLAVPKNNLTNIVNKLVKRKLLKRFRTEDDRRAVFVELTAKGSKLFEKEEEALLKLSEELLTAINKSEQNSLLSILNKMELL